MADVSDLLLDLGIGIPRDFRKEEGIKATGLKRYAGLAVRGATLGFKGAMTPPENLAESATEFIGSIPTIAATSAVASPLVGPALAGAGVSARYLPLASRL